MLLNEVAFVLRSKVIAPVAGEFELLTVLIKGSVSVCVLPAGLLKKGLCLFLIFSSRIFIELTKENQEAFEEGMFMNMGQLLSIPFVVLGLYCIIKSSASTEQKDRSSRD